MNIDSAMQNLIEAATPYRHYKGGLYKYLATGRLSEDRGTEVAIYWSVEKQEMWVRPLNKFGQDSFLDEVVWPDGVKRPRFIPEKP